MSEFRRGTNWSRWKPDDEDATPETGEIVDPMEETDDYPIDEQMLEEELEGSFPASDPPSSTPTTSIGAPEHNKD